MLNVMTGRSAANLLTRMTAVLAAAFFVTSITLSILSRQNAAPTSVLEGVRSQPGSGKGILDKLGPASTAPRGPQVPQSQ